MTADEIGGLIFTVLLLGGGFVFFSAVNYSILCHRWVKHEKTASLTPLLGGLCGAFLLLILNGTKHLPLLLIPLTVDPGCIPLMLQLIALSVRYGFHCITERLKKK